MTKYKKQVQEMLEAHKDLFEPFKELHDNYAEEPQKWQEKYNEDGQKVMMIMQRWENNLCAKSESSKYGKFSDKLADKFWEEIRTIFPKINYVGLMKK
ncbi:MAG: hypothetical protein AAB553_04170 [Patescibacteria group bacterium]